MICMAEGGQKKELLNKLLDTIELLTNPPNFVNVTRYHDKNLAKIAEIFQRKRSWFPMPWPLSSF